MLRDALQDLLPRRPVPVREITTTLARAALVGDPRDLPEVLAVSRFRRRFDELVAYPALAVLPGWGHEGLTHLVAHATEGPHRLGAVSVLTSVAMGAVPERADTPFLREGWDDVRRYAVTTALRDSAQQALRRLMLAGAADGASTSRLLEVVASQHWLSAARPEAKMQFLLSLLVDTHLVLNESILREFAGLLEVGPPREEVLHRFLVEHPVLLDPLTTQLRTKHELGSDFITDFVVRRINDEYVAVEIENSTDALFTAHGTFSQALSTAMGQVRDFQAWLADNLAYAQRKLPNIRRPEGLVVIGRRAGLSAVDARRLDEENFTRRSIMRVVTYDDLLAQARTIYRNMIERPPVLRARHQRTI